MNISYQREMKRNYLIIEAKVQDEVPFEQIMMEQNQIDGVLHFQVREKDTDIRYFYEITSKQPLSPSGRPINPGSPDPNAGEGNRSGTGSYGRISAE